MTQLDELYQIDSYIDTFALGHYARVLEAKDMRKQKIVAFKVLRPEHLLSDGDMRWEFRAFGNEAQILMKLKDSPHVVKLLDCGYVSTIGEAPAGGLIESFGVDAQAFNTRMTDYAAKGWRPYLTMENLPRSENLFYLMKPNTPNSRRRLPSEEGITLALQFANLLTLAHSQNIVYLDHKLEHVYWDGTQVKIIDFNSSKQLVGNTGDSQEYVKDLHNLCVGILYPIFTGMSPQKTSLRPQAGGQSVVDKRYDDILELDFAMEASLSPALQALLQKGAAQDLKRVPDFMSEIQNVAAQHGRDFPEAASSPASRQARDSLKKGLKALREGETKIREARDLFREALIVDSISPDLEAELRRLVKAVNDALNERVIP